MSTIFLLYRGREDARIRIKTSQSGIRKDQNLTEIYLFSSPLFYMQSSCHKFRQTCGKNRPMTSLYGIEEMTFLSAGSDSKTRIIHTRLFALLIFLLLMVSANRIESGLRQGLIDFAGLACVIVCAFGRVWSSIYISGHKTSALVEIGPYSVTRNPLYLFSLIGVAGIGLASGSLLILALLTLSFGLYYPSIIRRRKRP